MIEHLTERNAGARERSAVTLRRLRDADKEEIARTCFPDGDPEMIVERLREEMETQKTGLGWTLVAECDGVICGALTIARHNKVAWMHNVAVRADMRGRGIAQLMFEQAAQDCRNSEILRMILHVRRDNLSAIRAYEKAGFRFTFVDGMRGDQLRYERELSSDAVGSCVPQRNSGAGTELADDGA